MKNLTRKDIAKAAGVSPSTVSRALSGSPLLPKKTIEHVTSIATKLGYKPNILARRLASNRSFQIAFAVELWTGTRRGPIQMSYYSAILDAMVSEAFKRNFSVLVQPYTRDEESFVEHFSNLIQTRHADGLVFAGLNLKSRIPAELLKRHLPFVVIGSKSAKNKYVSVNADPYPAMVEMFNVLMQKKYRRIFFVEGDMNFHHAVTHREAFMKALKMSSLKLAGIISGDYSRRRGYSAAPEILVGKKKGDCVFFSNDRMATGFYRYCYENKVSMPDEIGVVGSDDDESALVLYPELSTIRQPRVEMGAAAVNLLMDMLEKKKTESVVIPNSFIARRSI
ncbi:MAG TPA: hypothetical protein DET40_02805 [Lentisphaeria bacterium]|nr:MAG: hypothetical protein A2X45_13990 [Lentisphaerae bacterium GWF2_50_93]HCE42459.1 hypothetical protein [Lentisphaeria bacterium]